ncbi:MAG: hypothetical protein GXX96_36495 [Planctomycetaceae bacterium]|nr:hypothetical protein [Planctomycetaceae bacterium]
MQTVEIKISEIQHGSGGTTGKSQPKRPDRQDRRPPAPSLDLDDQIVRCPKCGREVQSLQCGHCGSRLPPWQADLYAATIRQLAKPGGDRANTDHQGGDDEHEPLELSLSDRAAILQTGKQSPEHGIVYTPPHVAQFLFNLLSPLRPKIVLDVASGNGALSLPWRGIATVIEYELAFGNDFFKCPDSIHADLVLCNPPFGKEKEFLRRILMVVPQTTPVVIFCTHRVRLGSYASSHDWRWCRDEWPPITSIISLPRGVFKGVNDTVEILVFRVSDLLPHYFLPSDRDHDVQCGQSVLVSP